VLQRGREVDPITILDLLTVCSHLMVHCRSTAGTRAKEGEGKGRRVAIDQPPPHALFPALAPPAPAKKKMR
jgi:hypothetical protein